MKKILLPFLLLALFISPLQAAPRLVIDVGSQTQSFPADTQGAVLYVPATDTAAPRLVIDPSQLAIQFSMDSVMQAAEDKLRGLAMQFEGMEYDTSLQRKIGEFAGQIFLERELALLDLQIQNAVNLNDSVLLAGLKLALEELLQRNPELRNMILREALR
ncbi:hypothetical protein KKG05_08895 [bacterium]|nr:hypothetical protein [bacterium]